MKRKTHIPDIFISYSRSDQTKADRLTELLIMQGWEVWKDNRIKAGKEFEIEIIEALNQSKAVVVLWSNNSVNSEWVIREAKIAMEQKNLCLLSLKNAIYRHSLENWKVQCLSSGI
jgi:hypothetical protein